MTMRMVIMSSCQVGYITGILMDSLKEELAGDTAVISLAGSVQVKIQTIRNGPLILILDIGGIWGWTWA